MTVPVRIANCSGFFGDRFDAAMEVVEGADIDFLTGDWLAELTMYLLSRRRLKDPDHGGYAGAAVSQLSEVLPVCSERGIRIVTNAGGLDPQGCAQALGEHVERLGLGLRIAWLSGDDLLPAIESGSLVLDGLEASQTLLTANAYLGARGIRMALDGGADIVVTGRVTDAALVIGPASHGHAWSDDAWDEMAGALVAGHVIECGTQATGGNFSGYKDLLGIEEAGFPIAAVHRDGSSVIYKAEPSGGAVSLDTVTAQLLYEIQGPAYLSPDVSVDLRTVHLAEDGVNRVRISGARGFPPPSTLKVGASRAAGWRNTALVAVTGPDGREKVELAGRAIRRRLAARGMQPAELALQMLGAPVAEPTNNLEATTVLRVVATDDDRGCVDRGFSAAVTETALSSFPGFYSLATPSGAVASVEFVSARVEGSAVEVLVHLDDQVKVVPYVERVAGQSSEEPQPPPVARWQLLDPTTVSVSLGTIANGRSGDKGGDVNLGLWVDSDERYAWLLEVVNEGFMERVVAGEVTTGSVTIDRLPNLRGINVLVPGLLGRGAQATSRPDRQGKGFAEYVLSLPVDAPKHLLPLSAEPS